MSIINPRPKNLKDLLLSNRYFVPIYQRPYSWQKDEINQLWDDINENSSPYFLGILLLRVTDSDEKFEIVDGQQRITTLIMLLRAAVEIIGQEDIKAANYIQEHYICVPQNISHDKSEFIVRLSKRDREKFESILLGDSDKSKKYPSWRYLEDGFELLKTKLSEYKQAHGMNGLKTFLDETIMKITFIDLLVEKDSDVYLFFETLNDRGLDLGIADLVKNKVCSVAEKNHQSTEDAVGKIDEITEKIGTGKMASFLLHYCLSISDEPIPKNKLMDWYGKIIQSEKDVFLRNLGNVAPIYAELVDPDSINKRNQTTRKELLRFLKALDATRCYPLLLRGDIALQPKDFLRLCRAIEILTFRHSTITKKDAKVLEGVYFDLTKQIRKTQKVEEALNYLKQHAIKVTEKEFQASFEVYEPTTKQLARYILWKIEEFKTQQSIPLDWEQATLEHILPKSSRWEDRELYVNRLGNCTLLSQKLNSEVSNKGFEVKKLEYKKEGKIRITQELLAYKNFTKDSIIDIQTKFAELACKIWNPDLIV